MFDDISIIVIALCGIVAAEEDTGGSGDEKRDRAMVKIMEAIETEGGIYVTNKYVLKGLNFLLPLLIKYIVGRFNKSGFFVK